MKDRLEQYLDELMIVIKDAGAFAMDQLPLFIQEYLTYYAWYHGLLAVLMIGLTIATVFFIVWSCKNYEDWYWDEAIVSIVMFGTAGLLFLIPLSIVNILQFIKVIVAPRVYLLENLTSLL